ncbi:MAG TPA: hypothetical protein VD735_00670, partial [Candidatus Saccharimonadales bacterium]|nr:hypothetical protein [Candidatus Saccharimonadales bacterium]
MNYLRPLPHSAASVVSITSEVEAMNVQWPSSSAALGARGFGPLAVSGSQSPRPTASIAKIITALAVLEKQPLAKG